MTEVGSNYRLMLNNYPFTLNTQWTVLNIVHFG